MKLPKHISVALLGCFIAAALCGCRDDTSISPSAIPPSGTTETPRPNGEDFPSTTAKNDQRGERPPGNAGATLPSIDTIQETGSNAEPPLDGTAEPNRGQPVFRPSDTRPQHDDKRLARFGIFKYESKYLKLYTDIDPKHAKLLPAVIDRAYTAWEEYLGKLPLNRERTDFQITGYLMADKDLFIRVGLLPDDLPPFINGRHRGAEFWMNEQQHDYYRRHLMIHEATHCYMTIIPDTRPPSWYLEGMAELFGTHHIDASGTIRFRVMPGRKQDFIGLGRITMIQRAIQNGDYLSFDEIIRLRATDFQKNESYAWSWAVCAFFDTHPRYRDRFRKLSRHLTGTQFERVFREFFLADRDDLWTEWPLFAHHLQYGYDSQRAAIQFRAGKPLASGSGAKSITVSTNRGWQSSSLLVEKGQTYQVTASGRFTLASKPKPWISEPQGVSIRYFDGKPLGMLLATIRGKSPPAGRENHSMLRVMPIGRGSRFVAALTGTLYFRINDSWSELADNTGSVEVQVRRLEDDNFEQGN